MPKQWEKLAEAVEGIQELLIILHDDPDPDAIASGEALRYLLAESHGVDGQLAHRGIVGRAENRALVDYLGISLLQLPEDGWEPQCPVAILDTQPGAGNSPLPADYPAVAVIDHHGERSDGAAAFYDVRPWIGASSTILTQYLRAAGCKPTMKLATALFYGIKTDTKALSRDTSAADVAAYFYLLPFVEIDALVEIENAQVPAAYFRNLATAMEGARVYDDVVISTLGEMDYPDLAAEIADLFLRLEGVRWAICMGIYEDEVYLSVRARSEDANAEALARAAIGDSGSSGGRSTLAGGQAPVEGEDAEQTVEDICKRVLDYLDIPRDADGQPLLT